MLEGQYHTTLAVSLALNEDMHRIYPHMRPDSSADSISEGERIHAFWIVFTLDNSWAVALDTNTNICSGFDEQSLRVDTPWPLNLEEYTAVSEFVL